MILNLENRGTYQREFPFSSAHASKAEGEGSCLRCGIAKKPKVTKDQVLWPRAKKHPTIITDGTPFSSTHTYKAEGGGRRDEGFAFNVGHQKSQRLQRTKSFGLELKSTPQLPLKNY